nr:MAG TPA: hypothetical protein [Caudoviricetes sp.]
MGILLCTYCLLYKKLGILFCFVFGCVLGMMFLFKIPFLAFK